IRLAAGATEGAGPRIPIPVRSTYLSRIATVETSLGSESADVRDSARQLAKSVRGISREAWGVKAEPLTYSHTEGAELADRAACLRGLYEAEFAETEPTDPQAQIVDARELVAKWS